MDFKMGDGRMDLNTPLQAGELRVRSRMSTLTRSVMGRKDNRQVDDEMLVTEGPWGRLRISMDGFPVSIRADLDCMRVATLTARQATFNEEGPVMVYTDGDVPLTLGSTQGGLRFVAEGSRLRLAGRKRYLRATIGDQIWTFGGTETHTVRDDRWGKLFGSIRTATELRRGHEPGQGQLVTSWTNCPFIPEKGKKIDISTIGQNPEIDLTWLEGTLVSEIVLTLLLWQGVNQEKLDPLWWRIHNAAGDAI